MSSAWIANYEEAFATGFEALGEKRFVRKLVAHEAGEDISHGVWIGLNSRHGRLAVQPNLVVFCPAAAKFVREGLSDIYKNKPYHGPSKRLGAPVMSWPLYDLIYRRHDKDRKPSSYDVYAEGEIEISIATMVNDYGAVREQFFGSMSSLKGLEERLRSEHMPSSGMYAIAVGFLLNGRTSQSEITAIVGPSPNEMTAKFAEWFGRVYAS